MLFTVRIALQLNLVGAQWLSGRVLDSRQRGGRFEPQRRHCVVSLSKNINPSLVLVQPRKTRPYITERLLMGRKEPNKKEKLSLVPSVSLCTLKTESMNQGTRLMTALHSSIELSALIQLLPVLQTNGPRTDCSHGSSLIRLHSVCLNWRTFEGIQHT